MNLDRLLPVAEPTVEECGGRLVKTLVGQGHRVMIDEVRTWCRTELSAFEIRRLTRDRRGKTNRFARKALARLRRYRLERKSIIWNRRQDLILLRFDTDGDKLISEAELKLSLIHI